MPAKPALFLVPRRLRIRVLQVSGAFLLFCQTSLYGDDPVFELSPFVVSTAGDRGYTATSSLAGGRLATDLRDTAAAVTVFTPEFLADINATTFLEAARWAPNSIPQEELGGRNLYNDYAVNFRGLGLGFQSRNYFRWYINSDAYNTARIEFARGPNSLVFGDAGVGGVANVSSKRALGTGQTEVQALFSDWGGYRATVDADLKAAGNWFVRVALLHQDLDDWRDVGFDRREGAFITTTARPSARTEIRVEAEYGRLKRLITYNALDQFANWDGTTTNPGFIDLRARPPVPVPTSLTRYNTPRLVYNSSRPELGIIDLEGYAATSGLFGRGLLTEPQEGLPDFAVIPDYAFSLQAPNGGVVNPYWTTSAFLEHRLGENLFLEMALNYQYQERDITRWFFDQVYVDVNETLPGDVPNPYLGEIYGWARYWSNLQSNEVFDIRASVAYLVETDLTRQRLLLVGGHRYDRFEDHNYERVRTNGPNPNVTAVANRIFAHRYLSERHNPTLPPEDLDPVSGIESRVARTNGFFSEKPVSYGQMAASGDWFRDKRLHTLFGVRRDFYRENINDGVRRDPVDGELLEFGPKLRNNAQNVTSYTASGVYHLFEQLSLLAGYSESFDAGGTARTIDGGSLEPLLSEGFEFGVKVNAWENRIVGGITYYHNEQSNNRIGGESVAINGIWELLGQAENSVRDGYSDRQTFKGTGWEFELTALPRPNWRILVNLSLPETELLEGLLDTRAYYAANIDLWQSEVNRLQAEGDPGRANNIRNRITSIEQRIQSLETGRRLNNTFRYTANAFTRYYFTEGVLQGFSVGGGVNFRGKRLIGNDPGDPFAYLYARGYSLATFLVGYDRPLGSGELNLQVNISNLFDKEIVRPADPPRGLGFLTQDPRRFTFTARYRF